MRFSSHAAIVFGLFIAAVSPADGFGPIVRPRKGETVQAGSTFTIKWQSVKKYEAGLVNLFLQTNKETDELDWIQVISTDTESDTGEYKWNVNEDIPSGDNYYIKIGYINDVSVVNFSPRFKIQGSYSKSSSELANSTASITSTGLASNTASTMTTSSSTASSTSTSAPGPKSTAAGAVASRVVSPFALLLTVAIGFVAL